MIFNANFRTFEQQPLVTVNTGSLGGSFSAGCVKQAPTQCMIVNYGTQGAQVVFSPNAAPTAVNTAAAAGTRQVYVPAGAVMTVDLGNAKYFAAITDAGSTSLIFHAGEGS